MNTFVKWLLPVVGGIYIQKHIDNRRQLWNANFQLWNAVQARNGQTDPWNKNDRDILLKIAAEKAHFYSIKGISTDTQFKQIMDNYYHENAAAQTESYRKFQKQLVDPKLHGLFKFCMWDYHPIWYESFEELIKDGESIKRVYADPNFSNKIGGS